MGLVNKKDSFIVKQTQQVGGSSASRYWNQIQYNPTQVSNTEGNVNPTVPEFFHGPKYKEVFEATLPEGRKLEYFLRKEIEEYRNDTKKVSYKSKKDLMIKMLVDEVDRQHKRINFMENKIIQQKARILRMEDVLQQHSHRLLLRTGVKGVVGKAN